MKPVVVFAAWAGAAFGLLEGILLALSRTHPAILPAQKTSTHILWIAPLVDVTGFVIIACIGTLALRSVPRWRDKDFFAPALVFFVAAGTFAVADALGLIHNLAAVILSIGVALALRRNAQQLGRSLAAPQRLAWLGVVPLSLLGLAAGIVLLDRWEEDRKANALRPAPADAANVLFLILDTVRRDSFNDRLTPRSLTPTIDQLGARGRWYDNAWAASSWSLPSQATIMTGASPEEHQADWPRFRLSNQLTTLAEQFRARGYVTVAASGNASWITPEYFGRGFLRFTVYNAEDHLRRTTWGRIADRLLGQLGLHSAGRGTKAPTLNAQLLSFLDDHPERPFFGYLCYMDVNQALHRGRLNRPFWSRPATPEESFADYGQAVHHLDEHVGALMDELDRRGLLQKTIVVVASDHGESFGPGIAHDHGPSGHGTSLYVEQIRVPLVVIDGRYADGHVTSTEPLSLQVVPSMLAHMLGWATDPFSRRLAALPPNAALSTLRYGNRNQRSVAWSRWHIIRNLAGQPQQQLFNLDADPFETRSVTIPPPLPPAIARLLDPFRPGPSGVLAGR